jgi:hypothetical protein
MSTVDSNMSSIIEVGEKRKIDDISKDNPLNCENEDDKDEFVHGNDECTDNFRVFTKEEKKKLCASLNGRQKDLLITFGNIENYNLPDIKKEKWVARITEALCTEQMTVKYMVIAKEEADKACKFLHYHIAMKLDCKNAARLGTIKSKLYKLFNLYHGNIDIAANNNTPYIDKARYLICPIKDKVVDPNPKVYGETYEELCKRIENFAGKRKRNAEIVENWTMELIEAARTAEGSYEAFMKSEAFCALAWEKPYQCITAFREISKVQKIKLEEQFFPLSDYNDEMVKTMDHWYGDEKKKGDVLIFQGKPDVCKTRFIFSWAKERGYTVFKAPSSLREWYHFMNEDIILWDDMDEDRKDLGGQRLTQLFDGQITSLDVKCVQGIQVQCEKIIITMNEGFKYEYAPEKFKARTCLVSVTESLMKKPKEMLKYEYNSMIFKNKVVKLQGSGN